METTFNRRSRREYYRQNGILKMKKRLSFRDWCSMTRDNIKTGRQIHNENLDGWEKTVYENLQQRETKLIAHLQERGLNKQEVDSYLEKWYQTL